MNRFRKFNPGTFQSDEEVIAQFVVRKHELAIITDILQGNIDSPSCQHVLIVAPRGQGKSMLLARTAAEIRTNSRFRENLFPVVLMEENQGISSLSDFWLETLFHVARECSSRYPKIAQELRESHAELSKQWREQWHEERVLAAVLDAADQLSCRLVLMVENLQSLCSSAGRNFGWGLRKVLQMEPRIILLASATSRFDELDDARGPFFEMFRMIGLKRLNTRECFRLWSVIGDGEVSEREARPIEILTGGNPRLLIVIASFSRHKSLAHLMEKLVCLVDEYTEYFRSHLLALSPTESRVFAAVLDLWQFSTPSEIAGHARLDSRTTSTMLGRLVARRALAVEGNGKKRRYAAAEPLYCIYYKLRHNRDEAAIVENLIRFMSAFYSEEEREEAFRIVAAEGRKFPRIRQGGDRAANGLPELARPLPSFDQEEKYHRDISEALEREEYSRVIVLVDRAINPDLSAPGSISQEFRFQVLLYKAEAHYARREWKEAIAVLNQSLLILGEVAERFDTTEDPISGEYIFYTRVLQAEILMNLGYIQKAQKACSEYDRMLDTLNCKPSQETNWRSRCIWIRILLAQQDVQAAVGMFAEMYEVFIPGNEVVIRTTVRFATELIANGISAQELLEILLNEEQKADGLIPLVVALRQYSGEAVQAPDEILQVASDILNCMLERTDEGAGISGPVRENMVNSQ